MTEENYPPDYVVRWTYRWIEKRAARCSSRVIFTTDSTKDMYLERYPTLSADNCLVIPNGYDEEDFIGLTWRQSCRIAPDRPTRLIHAGLIYTDDRDPKPLFRALAQLKYKGEVNAQRLRIDLRAAGSEAYFGRLIKELGVGDIVTLLPPLPYQRALQDCADADGLVILQAASCNHQIPAKVYEYLRLQKPILALTTEQGDTARLLRKTGGATIINLEDERAILQGLPQFLRSLCARTHPLPDLGEVKGYDRRYQAAELAKCLSRIISTPMRAARGDNCGNKLTVRE
jgi:glycosyltransferase involved in cell wall biosynthesis